MNPGAGEGQPKSSVPLPDKATLRAELQAARTGRAPDLQLASHRTERALAACAGASVVAAYVARAGEPETAALIESLHRSGVRVLLPVLTTQPDWAWYTGVDGLAPGPRGIDQPTGARLGPQALAQADWIWLPGLAGTPDGRRLGTGGGWYDRALTHDRGDARRGLLLFDDEVLAEIPVDAWDQPVDLLVTEHQSLRCSPR
ncbi:5-formyltetrahydrofolate cyclo-ligase [Propionicimonas sp.]|uniref:5-formyltetrahydrofolate cyclo-ligase n=1 Tax=Propionicimonas sp. TaxID=1955623 RepID=UPI0017DB2126|nr:5-formyltetrahydrofolate cyclo-ligase [Propionicimonas sp.]MBU3975367.1 5-formyltetrahydrofolate cyclo-ligase [Actinomycetota bacterium]MBA3020227.1 5-formyltetrahydrofolate cyclo-ligase [Propionicimonas sp.]MBU3986484.1 5-formyltetrahydrofolate cyclo-ligase [Actinomycetota bacterium]MBU4008053.1 5-formyltetrahydrofolate cyclo-ligase [Actinomycetota bacterium]MBU4064311.1 5-formyltetrahydrofolate cyclo-ligase [Actinomycetota bacterium]